MFWALAYCMLVKRFSRVIKKVQLHLSCSTLRIRSVKRVWVPNVMVAVDPYNCVVHEDLTLQMFWYVGVSLSKFSN